MNYYAKHPSAPVAVAAVAIDALAFLSAAAFTWSMVVHPWPAAVYWGAAAAGGIACFLALTLCDVGPALLRDPPLLLDERREGLRAGKRQRALEIGGAALDLACDDLVEGRLTACDLVLEGARRGAGAPHGDEGCGRSDDRDERGGKRNGGGDSHSPRLSAPRRARRRSAPPSR
jgi:hypothetical protein